MTRQQMINERNARGLSIWQKRQRRHAFGLDPVRRRESVRTRVVSQLITVGLLGAFSALSVIHGDNLSLALCLAAWALFAYNLRDVWRGP